MAKYRKKPIVVEALLYTKGMEDGYADLMVPLGDGIRGVKMEKRPYIQTLKGYHLVEEGKHYIVTDTEGERYPIEREIFEVEYDLVEDCIGLTNMTLDKLSTLNPNERVLPLSELENVDKPADVN